MREMLSSSSKPIGAISIPRAGAGGGRAQADDGQLAVRADGAAGAARDARCGDQKAREGGRGAARAVVQACGCAAARRGCAERDGPFAAGGERVRGAFRWRGCGGGEEGGCGGGLNNVGGVAYDLVVRPTKILCRIQQRHLRLASDKHGSTARVIYVLECGRVDSTRRFALVIRFVAKAKASVTARGSPTVDRETS